MSRGMNAIERLREAHAVGYRVDEEGRVFSPSGRQLSLSADRDGYPRFSVKLSDGLVRGVFVHRLAAYQLFGEAMFEPGIEVRHKNGKVSESGTSNILIGTHSQNMQDVDPEVRRRVAGRAARKLTDEQVAQLRSDRAAGMKYVDLCAKYGLRKSTISYIVRGITCGPLNP